MKPYQQRLSIFLILLLCLGLTRQLNLEPSKDSKTGNLPNSTPITQQSQSKINNKAKDRIVLKNEQKPTKTASKQVYQGNASIYKSATEWSYGGLQIYYLDRHTVDCNQSNSAINSFNLEIGSATDDPNTTQNEQLTGKKVRYSYSCVKSPNISDSCRNFSTTPNRVFFFEVSKAIKRLNRHYLECPDNQVMKKFGMKSSGIFDLKGVSRDKIEEDDYPKIWYEYTCCNAETSRTTYFETELTPNSDDKYYSLKNQKVNSKDFNALSAFNFQCPENKIFYSAKIQILKGETSPAFPDPCLKSPQSVRMSESSTNGKNEAGNKSKVFLGKYVYFN
jgi:hypothetical protein